MPLSPQTEVTRLLVRVREGDQDAMQALFPLVYDELRARARRHRQQWQGNHSLNTTALVHEAYLKLVDQRQAEWNSRVHFLGVAARAMRHILIDYARQRQAEKRGGDRHRVSLKDIDRLLGGDGSWSSGQAEALLDLNDALERLEQVSKRQSRIVECRFFGGMTVEETAAALDLSPATVKRGWAMAQAWLYREIESRE